MAFDMNAIPPDMRGAKHVSQHMEMAKEALDTWKVYNPDDTDYVMHWDKYGVNEKYLIPNKNKDIGFGKGCQHVPAYVMRNYRSHKGTEMMNKIIKEDWEKKKVEFRLEDRGMMEQNLALRTTDPDLWKKIIPIIIKGRVSKYGGDDIPDEIDQTMPDDRNKTIDEIAMQQLNIPDIEEAKDNLAGQIQ